MEHARQLDIVNVGRARELCGKIETRLAFSNYFVLRKIFKRNISAGFAREADFARERPIARAQVGAGDMDRAVAHLEIRGAHLELARGGLDEELAHLGARGPHRAAAGFHRQAAGGVPLVGGNRGISGHHDDALKRDIELLGGDLRDRRDRTLAKLDLAGEDRHGVARIDAHPALEARVRLKVCRQHSVCRQRSVCGQRSVCRQRSVCGQRS